MGHSRKQGTRGGPAGHPVGTLTPATVSNDGGASAVDGRVARPLVKGRKMLKRLGAALAIVLAIGAATVPAAMATTSNTCFDSATFGARSAACQTATIESRVNVAQVTMGLHSFGWFSLVCARGDDVVTRDGAIGIGGRRTITMDRLGLSNPTCYLEATAVGSSSSRNARGTVTLFD